MWICKSCEKENQDDHIACLSCSAPKDEITVPSVPPQPLESPFPTAKVYTQMSIWGGSLLGGPMVAGYIIAKNFKAFGESNKARVTWIVTIGATAVILGMAFLLSDTNWRGIPVAYTAMAYGIIRHYQGAKIDAHVRAGGATYSYRNIIGVSLVGLLITLIPFTVIVVAVGGVDTPETPAVKEYQAVKNDVYFLRSNISEAEVDKLAAALTKTGFFNEASQRHVNVCRVKDTYEISILCTSEIKTNPDAYKVFIPFRNGMQQLFPNNKIILKLVVGDVDNVVKRIE